MKDPNKYPNKYPKGWDRKKVLGVLKHYCGCTMAERKQKFETRLWVCEDFSAGSSGTRWTWKIYIFKPRAQFAYAVIQPGFVNYGSKLEARKFASNVARELGISGKWMV